jgi:hypothetical protein
MSTTNTLIGMLIIALGIAFVFSIVFAIYYAMVWVFCWAFGITFVWKYVIGVWIVVVVLGLLLKKKRLNETLHI